MKKFAENRLVGLVMIAAGIIMMGYGFYRGEVDTVFTKAINICLECIGIG